MKYFTAESLGAKQSLTPDGFLLCRDVAIARTGQQIYAADEIPTLTSDNGMVVIDREESQVFRPETLASFEGKPVTDDHPNEGVSPDNWKDYAVGVTLNVRRGTTSMDSDLIIADLLITDKDAIKAVRDGKREVSCGYDADYEQISPGRGRQTNIIGNHVALVDKGRCGSRCAIKDKNGVSKMSKIKDKIMAAFKLGNEDALAKTLDELPDNDTTAQGVHIHMGNLTADKKPDAQTQDDDKLKKLVADSVADALKAAGIVAKTKDKKSKDEDEEEEGDDTMDEDMEEEVKEKSKDSAAAIADLASRAEILSPGFKVTTADCGCKDRKKAKDAQLATKRRVLDAAYRTAEGQAAINPFLPVVMRGKTVDFANLSVTGIEAAFVGASELMRQANNVKTSDSSLAKTRDFSKQPMTPAEINANAAKFWVKN